MKNNLKLENLVASHYYNGLHELEFYVNGLTIFVRNIKVYDKMDEFYWDVAKNVRKAVRDAVQSDIEVADPEDNIIGKLNVLGDFGYTQDDISAFAQEIEDTGSFEFEAEMQTWDMVEFLQYAGFRVETEELGEDNYKLTISE